MKPLGIEEEKLKAKLQHSKNSPLTVSEIDTIILYLKENANAESVELEELNVLYAFSQALYNNFKYEEATIGITKIIHSIWEDYKIFPVYFNWGISFEWDDSVSKKRISQCNSIAPKSSALYGRRKRLERKNL